jgi:hypothetical protein
LRAAAKAAIAAGYGDTVEGQVAGVANRATAPTSRSALPSFEVRLEMVKAPAEVTSKRRVLSLPWMDSSCSPGPMRVRDLATVIWVLERTIVPKRDGEVDGCRR